MSDTPLTTVRRELGQYLELSKAKLASMVVFSAVAGYFVAAGDDLRPARLAWTIAGVALAAFGANIFNQIREADLDALMDRTRDRPLPSGRTSRITALWYGWGSSVIGVLILALLVNGLTALLTAGVIAVYTLVYTPMKTRTSANTLVGAVVGALPPVIGWTATTGRIETGALVLFGILFAWQIPHFLALAWIYREDYARAGFKMLPSLGGLGPFSALMALMYGLALLPLTVLVFTEEMAGLPFLVIGQILGIGFLTTIIPFLRVQNRPSARRVFFASIIYLPLLLLAMVADRQPQIAAMPVADSTLVAPVAGTTPTEPGI